VLVPLFVPPVRGGGFTFSTGFVVDELICVLGLGVGFIAGSVPDPGALALPAFVLGPLPVFAPPSAALAAEFVLAAGFFADGSVPAWPGLVELPEFVLGELVFLAPPSAAFAAAASPAFDFCSLVAAGSAENKAEFNDSPARTINERSFIFIQEPHRSKPLPGSLYSLPRNLHCQLQFATPYHNPLIPRPSLASPTAISIPAAHKKNFTRISNAP